MLYNFKNSGKASLVAITIQFAVLTACQEKEIPLARHPDNGKYFIFKDQPTVLIGSTEHYGALMNLDFDYQAYFETLQKTGLNTPRTFDY